MDARLRELEEENARLRAAAAARDGIAGSIADLVGRTPLLRVSSPPGAAELVAKLEFLNPGGSVKDRAALEIVLDAERQGKLVRGSSILVDARVHSC